MDNQEPRLLTVEEAVDAARRQGVTGLGRTALYQLLNSHRIASVKLGRRRYVPVEEIDRFVAELVDQACRDREEGAA